MKNSWKWMGVMGLGLLAMTARVRAEDGPGPIDSLQDLQDTGRMLFKVADTNNDGQISQKEAIDAGNLLVGGFFFRADANGDGTVTKEEAQQAREALMSQKPVLRYVIERAKTAKAGQAGGTNPLQSLGTLFDTNADHNLQASELRNGVQTAVQGIYAVADTNRDGQMSPAEINAAIAGFSKSLAQTAFQSADKNNDGQISQQEFEQAIVEPSRMAFKVLDGNNDGQISQQEAQGAQRVLESQFRALMVPEAPNSPRRLIQTGQTPGQVTPVPNFGTPGQPAVPLTPVQPGQTQPPPATPR